MERSDTALSRNLSRIRNLRGLTQHELAEKSGISRTAIASIEGGTYKSARTTTVYALAKALSVRTATLLAQPRASEAGR